MTVRVGPVDVDSARTFLEAMGTAFGFDPDDGDVERFSRYFEWDRARAAYEGNVIVGTIGAYSLDMTVPGGTMPCGGTTVVAVRPTHRRRGVLRAMMGEHLAEMREREEPIAGLWASDSAIYGRFGYGCAALSADLEMKREYSRFHRLAPDPDPVRMIEAAEAPTILPGFYERMRDGIPGLFARSDMWWELRHFRDNPEDRQGATAYRYAVTEGPDGVSGYVQYRFKENWANEHGEGEVRVRELFADQPTAWAGLWRFVLDHDLTAKITASRRSLEDPLLEMLDGRRRARLTVSDSLWVRIMDVKAALTGRRYRNRAVATVAVHDPWDGRVDTWQLELGPEGAEVTATDRQPDVELDLADLGACFMGWSRLAAMGRAGRVVGNPDTLAALDLAFSWSPSPWCAENF